MAKRKAHKLPVRILANRAVAKFLLSNPAPIGGEFWRERDVSVHGYYMFMAGYRAHERAAKNAYPAINNSLPICLTHGPGCGNDLATCRFAPKRAAKKRGKGK